MSLVFEKVSQALSAGEKLVIGIAGSFLRLAACQWPVQVTLIKDNRIVGTMNNLLAGDYVEGVEFDSIWIINGTTNQLIEAQISGGGAGSNRVLGEVSVIDGGRYRTMADVAKAGSFWCSALAGNFSHVQLWNPVGSGRNLIIEQVGVATDHTAIGMSMVISNVQLSTLYAVAASKKSGGANSVASGYTQQAAAHIGGASSLFLLNHASIYVPREPIIVAPGYGLIVRGQAVAQGLQGSFEFYEEKV